MPKIKIFTQKKNEYLFLFLHEITKKIIRTECSETAYSETFYIKKYVVYFKNLHVSSSPIIIIKKLMIAFSI